MSTLIQVYTNIDFKGVKARILDILIHKIYFQTQILFLIIL